MANKSNKNGSSLPPASRTPGWEGSDEAFLLAQEIVIKTARDLEIDWFPDSLANFLKFMRVNKKKVSDQDYEFLVSKTSDLWDLFRKFMMSPDVAGQWSAEIKIELNDLLVDEFMTSDSRYEAENAEEFDLAELTIGCLEVVLTEDKQVLANAIFENIVIFWIYLTTENNEEFEFNSPVNETDSEDLEFMQMIIDIRDQASKQMLYGLAWWAASSIAVYLALGATGGTIYWFGGAIGALFHWYRAFKLIETSKRGGAKTFVNNDGLIVAVILIVVMFSSAKLIPEYLRISTPTVGTCWADTEDDFTSAVACWSSSATTQTIGFAYSAESCLGDYYLEPTSRESRFTCLKSI
jgi:hypothetical protein